MPASTGSRGRSPASWIALGCGAVVVLGGIAVISLGYFGYRRARQWEGEIKDPAARAARVAEVLGTETLPAGYHPALGLSIPFVMETAILTDHEVPAGKPHGEEILGDRGFFYVKTLQSERKRRELEDYFAGRSTDSEVLRDLGLSVHRGEKLGEGHFTLHGADVRFVAQRSRVDFRSGLGRRDKIVATLLIDCPEDEKLRLGIWFGPTPAASDGEEELDLTATPADEAALREFVAPFHFCAAKPS